MDPSQLDPSTDEFQLRAEGVWDRNTDMLREATATRKKSGRPKGYIVSPETIEKIRKAKLGKALSPAQRKAIGEGQRKRFRRYGEQVAARQRAYEVHYNRQNPDYEHEEGRWAVQEKLNADRLAAIEERRDAAIRKIIDEVDRSGLSTIVAGNPDLVAPEDVLALSRVVLAGLMGRPVPSAQYMTLRSQKTALRPTTPITPPPSTDAPRTLIRKVLDRVANPSYVVPGGERKLLGHALLHDETLNDADRALIQEVLARE